MIGKLMKNETLEIILNRRSARKFRDEQIGSDSLETIIQAGLFAPSAMNQQSWHFTVIQNKEILDEINTRSKKYSQSSGIPYLVEKTAPDAFHVFYHAPTVIVVSGSKESYSPLVDCAAAIQNMLIAAESLGISTCWIGIPRHFFNSEEGKEYIKKLEIPEGYEANYCVALGYRVANNPAAAPGRKDNSVNYIK
jgi:nitroreductase